MAARHEQQPGSTPFSELSEFDEERLLTRARLRVGTVLRDKYTIDGVLGAGGMATVYAVTHRNGQRFALKLLHPELADRESVRKRFVREGYAANAVGHDGVARVFDDDVDESGAPFLLMELLLGESVKALCPAGTPMPTREALGIAVQLLDVLSAAHQQDIVHRDIKPSNLFVTLEGDVKVLDFGIAQLRESAYDHTLTRTGTSLGTPPFMAPEQARAKAGEIDARSDIFAVGATLFTMLSGRHVHDGDNPAHVRVVAATEPARSLSSVAPDVPSRIVRIVDKALAFEKAARFESSAVMRDAVSEVLADFYGPVSREPLALLARRTRADRREDDDLDGPPRVLPGTEAETSGGLPLSSPDDKGAAAPSGSDARRTHRQRLWAWWPVLAVGILAGIWLLATLPSRDSRRSVSVVVTTDMLVPTDLDWVGWRVKSGDGEVVLQSGERALSDWRQLPAWLVDIPARDLVRLEVEARRGGRNGRLTIDQELLFRTPETGAGQLEVPLDLLCSRDADPSRCKAGQQCMAGACADISFTAPGPAQPFPSSVSECFPAAQCFASGVQVTIPTDDPLLGRCVLKKSPVISNGREQNIGLLVNTALVSSRGACGPSGRCVVPLDHGGPRGWQLIEAEGRTLGARLPTAVCQEIASNRILGVVIAPATPGCPAKSSDMPLCPVPDTCAARDGICPDDLPPAWVGFACEGAANPQMTRPDLLACFVPPSKGAAVHQGEGARWCCSTGERPSDDPLLIDDMTGGPQIKRPPADGASGGLWWTASDAVEGVFSPPLTPGLFTYRTISPPVVVDRHRTFDRAACFKSSGFSGWYALMGFAFKADTSNVASAAVDISRYTGMRFWGYSPDRDQTIAIRISDRNTFTEVLGSTCNQNPRAGRCGDDWGVQRLTLTPDWREYTVAWSDFTQSPDDWGQARFDAFDRTQVYHAYFAISGRGPERTTTPFEFCVSQIHFTQAP